MIKGALVKGSANEPMGSSEQPRRGTVAFAVIIAIPILDFGGDVHRHRDQRLSWLLSG